ncbi:uncharacterized protein LOC129098479 [Anoplopoma fimbria]|uniref:uncharacterized protein LOC129098479 n=1 Tax=Anoplopoma fimbria TaxID=229290 RepID=UPI0023EB1525|nr:uncharacterized protein LOC129098479 [Anoplopoma fimbria]
MMKMTGRVLMCVALLLLLSSVSAGPKLRSINSLKKIDFGQSVPEHSLVLLYWFANAVNIDANNNIWLTFDPNRGDYSSHPYHNSEGLLDVLPWGNVYRYYTIGNLNQETSMPLPAYVVDPPLEYEEGNRDRIIIRVREQNTGRRAQQRIDQVYITQHYDTYENMGTDYDPDHTYRITINLLRQIREFSVGGNQQQLLQLRNRFGSNADVLHITNTWGELAFLGLLLFIVIQEKNSSNQQNRPEDRRSPLDDNSDRETNVPRGFRNQGYVVLNISDDEDQNVSRTTRNRESHFYNTCTFCCKSCVCSVICLIALGAILLFLFGDKLK